LEILNVEDQTDSLWEEFESATQIARDLEGPTLTPETRGEPSTQTSSYGEFDLTTEELDELQPQAQSAGEHGRSLMAPPALPEKIRNEVAGSTGSHRNPSKPSIRTPAPMCANEHRITLSQLKAFVDDDLQLTQATPG